jgi:hypothetical protein
MPDDLAAVVPADGYSCQGMYVVDFGHGPALFHAEKIIGSPEIEVWHSAPALSHQRVPIDFFNRSVVAKVFATIKMLDHRVLRTLAGGRA